MELLFSISALLLSIINTFILYKQYKASKNQEKRELEKERKENEEKKKADIYCEIIPNNKSSMKLKLTNKGKAEAQNVMIDATESFFRILADYSKDTVITSIAPQMSTSFLLAPTLSDVQPFRIKLIWETIDGKQESREFDLRYS